MMKYLRLVQWVIFSPMLLPIMWVLEQQKVFRNIFEDIQRDIETV